MNKRKADDEFASIGLSYFDPAGNEVVVYCLADESLFGDSLKRAREIVVEDPHLGVPHPIPEWRGGVKSQIRLTGQWLERTCFKPAIRLRSNRDSLCAPQYPARRVRLPSDVLFGRRTGQVSTAGCERCETERLRKGA